MDRFGFPNAGSLMSYFGAMSDGTPSIGDTKVVNGEIYVMGVIEGGAIDWILQSEPQTSQPSAWDLFKQNTGYSFGSTNNVMFSKPAKWGLGVAAGAWASSATGLRVFSSSGIPLIVAGPSFAYTLLEAPAAVLTGGAIYGVTAAFGTVAGAAALEGEIAVGSVIYGAGATVIDLFNR